ncbi:hypothetical protein PL11201_580084 [Planktothrix sp. PCC 11201]|uniref:sulfotransferase family 2 domain-containing protein n=1 Tax=Planktothrix sp. PCC 11201 TaxID=1729650 RepID=UPI000912DDD1|nr:sulfotransferase family 2 domain-containing protein [Planktothrix sp. PCC 11201]SKB14092.1 hypothetical protein PL11201_580084 [Planktothrix sp. PCC 11201]
MVSYISIHIPKTAGTTLGYLLDYGTSRRILWDYCPDYSNALLKPQEKEYLLKHKEFIEKQFDVIHGHFYYSKYSWLFPNAKYITCVRHPVARVISHFQHIMNEKNEQDYLYQAVKSNQIDIIDFASIYDIGNAHTVHLKGQSIQDYDFIFINERFDESFYLFQKKFNFQRQDEYMNKNTIPFINKSENRNIKKLEFSNDIIQEIYKRTVDDNEIYKESILIFEEIMKDF